MSRATARISVALLLLIYAAFMSLGLPDGLLGAAWPQMRSEFGAGLSDNWAMLALATCGGALSSFFSGWALLQLGASRLLISTAFLTALVVLGYSLSPALSVVTALAFFLGLGNGAIDAGLNNFVASHLSSRHMNWLHAFWGVGMSLGTLIISGVIAAQGTWRMAYQIVGALQLGLALTFLLGPRLPPAAASQSQPTSSEPAPSQQSLDPSTSGSRRSQSTPDPESPASLETLALPATWVSMSLFFVYCGVESSTGLWIASALHDGQDWAMEAAALMATLYWGSLTVGRFLMGTVSQRTTPTRIVKTAGLSATVGTLLLFLSSVDEGEWSAWIGACGLLLTGLSFAPVYPMLMHDTPRLLGRGHARNLIGFQAGAAHLGYTLVPIAVGLLMSHYSPRLLGTLLVGLTLGMLLLILVRQRPRG